MTDVHPIHPSPPMPIRLRIHRYLRLWVGSLSAGLVQVGLLAFPGFSAERIFASYGPLERDIAVDALETYALTGELTEELAVYSRYLTPEQLEQVRDGLLVSADIDVIAVSQFLYTPQGEAILQGLGEVIQTAGRLNGAKAIRAAVILAAANPDGGLNVLNVLKHFPTEGVRLDLGQFSVLARAVIAEIDRTNQATAQIQAQATAAAAATDDRGDRSLAAQGVLAAAGPTPWTTRTLNQVALPTDLYLPEGQNLPLVVISHGVGGDRTTLAYLARHLASHGLAVAVVEHTGSNAAKLSSLLAGQAQEAIEPEELVRRPVAIQTLLDELTLLTQEDPTLRNRLNFQNVGILGQSFGAYTTLGLAGATVNLAALDTSCPPEITQLNLSLLLQCLVPSLPRPLPPLQDERVKAAVAINPLNSVVFGRQGLENISIPIMMVSGSDDTVTPALAEQIRPFTWLTSPERYFLLMQGGTHFSTIFDPQAIDAIPVPEVAIGPSPAVAQRYVKVMGLAFFKTYLVQDESYRQYLSPSFALALSQPGLPLALIRDLDLDE